MATATNVTVIPAKPQTANNRNQYKQLRVAAYCRVSTEQEEQLSGADRVLHRSHQWQEGMDARRYLCRRRHFRH